MSSNTKDMAASRRKLQDSFDSLLEGAEELLRSTASFASDESTSARAGMRRRMDDARHWVDSVESAAAQKYRAASDTTGAFVRLHPAKAVGIAALVGIAVALLLQRR